MRRGCAQVGEPGGARRRGLRGLEYGTKRYLMYVAGKNPGVIMRALFGMGKPRTLQTEGGGGFWSIWATRMSPIGLLRAFRDHLAFRIGWDAFSHRNSLAPDGRVAPRRILAAA